uniref:Uncharacterized protein n=1 Tax=viral metagenome TaxID=1070528 RepID=A0A6C0ADI4_9ZZZZ
MSSSEEKIEELTLKVESLEEEIDNMKEFIENLKERMNFCDCGAIANRCRDVGCTDLVCKECGNNYSRHTGEYYCVSCMDH